MNAYTTLLIYLKTLAEKTGYINTITKGQDIDLNKGNIFPLFNIDILTGNFTSNATISFDVELQCLDIRDINKKQVNDKFWGNDNESDNHNNTLAALNNIWTKLHRDFELRDITASDSPTITKVTFSDKNLLDGWSLSFTVEMPIAELDLCDETD